LKKFLFFIHDLGHGGAEKVLVNLVNNMDPEKFDITVQTLFDVGENRQFLKPHVRYIGGLKKEFPGNSHVMKLATPRLLHRMLVKEHYDIEVAYLEGPAARVISGCENKDTKTACWIHCTMSSVKEISKSFRNINETEKCYNAFDKMVFVSEGVRDAFVKNCPVPAERTAVLYNVNESEIMLQKAAEPVDDGTFTQDSFKWCGVGKLLKSKGFDRMLRIQKRLIDEGYKTHFYALGVGPLQEEMEQYCEENNITDSVTLLGYQTNPYKYVANCDLFVCASHAEGFSTAATEALIVGTPVVTTRVSGMEEMLGCDNKYGIITDNDENALYEGIKKLLDDKELYKHYKEQAAARGKDFSTEKTVAAVEKMLEEL